jgi:predicted amidophosphoribosyltransferase
MECGHGGICYECGKHLIAEGQACHLCREEISYVLKMDLSTVYNNFIKVISATFMDDESEGDSENDENGE